jgi:hypothetical protein
MLLPFVLSQKLRDIMEREASVRVQLENSIPGLNELETQQKNYELQLQLLQQQQQQQMDLQLLQQQQELWQQQQMHTQQHKKQHKNEKTPKTQPTPSPSTPKQLGPPIVTIPLSESMTRKILAEFGGDPLNKPLSASAWMSILSSLHAASPASAISQEQLDEHIQSLHSHLSTAALIHNLNEDQLLVMYSPAQTSQESHSSPSPASPSDPNSETVEPVVGSSDKQEVLPVPNT